jgi:S1-C subfamily serine protease
MRRLFTLLAIACFAQPGAFPQTGRPTKAVLAETTNATSLTQLSTSLQEVARKVEPSVVQIFNSSYVVERGGETVVLQQRSSGSGILITSDGYIVTNAHVVEGFRRLQVRLNAAASNIGSRLLNAKLIGKDRSNQDRSRRPSLSGLRRFRHFEPGTNRPRVREPPRTRQFGEHGSGQRRGPTVKCR